MTKNAPLIPADWVIQSPGELEALMARLHELLEAGVLVQIDEPVGGIGSSDILAVPKSGPWPDVIHAEFRDAGGLKYRLSVDTYHGHGGSWRSILASTARPLDHVVTPLGRTGLRYAEGDRSMFIDSEMLARPNGIAVYRASIVRWDPPHESDAVSEGDRARILASTVEALQLQGLDVDVIWELSRAIWCRRAVLDSHWAATGNIEMASTMTSKGQVTVPTHVREFLGVGPGSAIEFELRPNGDVVIRAAITGRRPPGGRFARLRDRATVKLSTDEILALTRGAWFTVIPVDTDVPLDVIESDPARYRKDFPTFELIAPS